MRSSRCHSHLDAPASRIISRILAHAYGPFAFVATHVPHDPSVCACIFFSTVRDITVRTRPRATGQTSRSNFMGLMHSDLLGFGRICREKAQEAQKCICAVLTRSYA